ncbi:unnamed protein product [Haemonchus placei]|uniref:Uncharacterized protein n=1 Tax=Haemonchus placei TaxID=6290 RepID=A0A0N4W3X4_HAEPC|nr:unnamed protein product [Haemonchus placei]
MNLADPVLPDGYIRIYGHKDNVRIFGLEHVDVLRHCLAGRVRISRPGHVDIFHVRSVRTFRLRRAGILSLAYSDRTFGLGCDDVGIFCVDGLDDHADNGSLSRLLVGSTRILCVLVRQVGSAGISGLERVILGSILHVVVENNIVLLYLVDTKVASEESDSALLPGDSASTDEK